MQNVTVKIDAATVQRIVEKHIGESLALGLHARANVIVAGYDPSPTARPGQPTVELTVTFETVKTDLR